MRIQELVVYRDFGKEEGRILQDISYLAGHYRDPGGRKEEMASLLYDCIHRLLEPEAMDFMGTSGIATCPTCW